MTPPITTVSSYGAGGSSARVRLFDWLAHLRLPHRSIDYLGAPDNRPSTLLRRWPSVAVAERRLRSLSADGGPGTVLLSREASPFSNGRVEEGILRRADRGIYDFDDALFAYPTSGVRRLWSKRKVWSRSVRAADVVIAGNDYLAQAASELASDVVMIPSCVEPADYARKTEYELAGPPVAVWIGSPSTESYLGAIAEPLRRLHDRFGLRLLVVSSGSRHLGPIGHMVDRADWTLDSFAAHLAGADLGIMPLPDTAYSRGKCAYKLLQYGASALPMVASPVGANALALQRMGGLSVRTDTEWVDAIAGILELRSSERAAMGASARTGVETHYSFAAWRPVFEAVLSR